MIWLYRLAQLGHAAAMRREQERVMRQLLANSAKRRTAQDNAAALRNAGACAPISKLNGSG